MLHISLLVMTSVDVFLASKGSYHYANTPMLYTAFFHDCKNVNFQMKNCDIFLIFTQNIDRWYMYTLEPLH